MGVQGELGDLDLAGILQMLAGNRATGRLHVRADGDDVALYLDAGRLVSVASTRLPLRLGRVLRQQGSVTDDQVRDALLTQCAEDRRRTIGAILLDRGLVTEAGIASAVQAQCVAVLTRALAARVGRFVWAPGLRQTARGTAPLDAQTALMESLCRADELGRLRALLPPPDAPLTVNGRAGRAVAGLSANESRVLAALSAGVGSWGVLADRLPIAEADLLRTLLSLRARGLVADGPRGVDEHDRTPAMLPTVYAAGWDRQGGTDRYPGPVGLVIG